MKKNIAALVLFLVGFSLYAQNFEWSLILADLKNGVSLPFSRPVALRDGDTVSVFILSAADAYVYIIGQDPERNVEVFYSGAVKAGENFRTGPIQLLPPGGQETIHIIVSGEREVRLEAQIAAYQAEKVFRAGRNVVSAALELRREILLLTEAPERPVQMGGSFRGFDNLEGSGYSGAGKYFKTILINH
jgi:hypothetical protein